MMLLDTNIVSFFFKQHRIWHRYYPLILGRDLAINFQTRAELIAGSLVAKWSPARYSKLEQFLVQFSMLHSDDTICQWWGEIQQVRRSQPISCNDAWIAATALSYDFDLVTHNPKDFEGIPGLRIVTAAK